MFQQRSSCDRPPAAAARPGRRPAWWPVLLVALAAAPVPVLGADDDGNVPRLELSGFGSAGLASQHAPAGWGLQRSVSQAGDARSPTATLDSRLGMQGVWNGVEHWSAAAQVVAMDRAPAARADEALEWAYLGWRPVPETQVRLGRAAPDIFLFADSRNVGFALPWARPPADFYALAPSTSVDGLHLAHQWSGGDATWRLKSAYGRARAGTGDPQAMTDIALDSRVATVSLVRESEDLVVKGSYIHADSRLGGRGLEQLRQALAELSLLPVPAVHEVALSLRDRLWVDGTVTRLALGLQWDQGPWTVIAEASDMRDDGSLGQARRAYLSAGRRLGTISLFALASRTRARLPAAAAAEVASALTPLVGPAQAAQAQALVDAAAAAANDYRSDQHSVAAGLRWDFSSSAALKFQVERYDVQAGGAAAWYGRTAQPARITIGSLVLDFVWGP